MRINDGLEVDVLEIGNGAHMKYKVCKGAKLKVTISSLNKASDCSYQIKLDEYSDVDFAYADFDSGNKNVNFVFDLNGNEAKFNYHVASLVSDANKKIFDISFNHNALGTSSNVDCYGVAENEGSLNFTGVGYIKNGAKRTKCHQNAKIMVFDQKCNCKASPILKIDDNDVEASHSATVGKVNDEHLFYLTSRGISENDAKRLITLGYLNPIIKHFEDEQIAKDIQDAIEGRV